MKDQPIRQARHLAELYRLCAEQYGALPAFATRRSALDWVPLSFQQLYEQGKRVAGGLMALGVQPGDAVGLISDNRVEWMIAETGIQLCAAVNTPRGTDVTYEEWRYIFAHAGVQVAFVETPRELKRLNRMRADWPALREVILLHGEAPADGTVRTLAECEALGAAYLAAHPDAVAEREQALTPDDLFTLIYTSGTTGQPKGVMLTHAHMMSQIRNVPLELNCTDRVLSILPIWHIFERMFEVFTMSRGVCTYYTSLRTLGEDLQHVEPTFMGSAPRLWESLHHRIMQGVRRAHPIRRLLFHIAYRLSCWYRASLTAWRNETLHPPPAHWWVRGPWLALHAVRWVCVLPWYGFFNAAVLENVRLKAGGCLKATISGGGALPSAIDAFFSNIGIDVLEGYGLTETCPVLAVRVPGKKVRGTVGPVIPQTELRIVDIDTHEILYPPPADSGSDGIGRKGEIQVRGPQVMKGYYKDPELTRTVLSDDGWFRTGDLGAVTRQGCLRILGRCKSTIVLLNGENVEPEPIEGRLRLCSHIENVAVMGQDRKHLYALVVPDEAQFQQDGHPARTLAELADDESAHRLIWDEIREMQRHPGDSGRHPAIHAIRLLPEPFTRGVELTNLFKLKRHVVETKYATELAELYATENLDSTARKERR